MSPVLHFVQSPACRRIRYREVFFLKHSSCLHVLLSRRLQHGLSSRRDCRWAPWNSVVCPPCFR